MRLKTYYINNLSFSSTLAMAELPQDSEDRWYCSYSFNVGYYSGHFSTQTGFNCQEGQQRYAVFGIPLSTPLGSVQLDTNKAPIQIEVKSYPLMLSNALKLRIKTM